MCLLFVRKVGYSPGLSLPIFTEVLLQKLYRFFFIQKKCNSAVSLQCFMPCLFLTQRWLRFCDHVELVIFANRVESVASAWASNKGGFQTTHFVLVSRIEGSLIGDFISGKLPRLGIIAFIIISMLLSGHLSVMRIPFAPSRDIGKTLLWKRNTSWRLEDERINLCCAPQCGTADWN